MISKTTFEESLCKNAGLFSIAKTETDLFLLLQTTILTYDQLHTTQLHGKTEAAGRLSLKRLEKSGLIQAKTINNTQTKYYFLTAKGKNYAKKLFPLAYLETIHINFDRRIPYGHLQLIHRINTNDFYVTYIGYTQSTPYPWRLETPLSKENSKTPARCDGHLATPYAQYFIEQDNNTQSEAVLLQKITQYQDYAFFNSNNTNQNLVFCLAFPKCQPAGRKPSYSIYKILLRISKLWEGLEKEQQLTLDFDQFLQLVDSPRLLNSVSDSERISFRKIHAMHPGTDSLNKINLLKKSYLGDTAYFEAQSKELDVHYKKRLKSHYRRFYEGSTVLLAHAHSGKSIFAIPNHRLAWYQPYIMCHEYHLSEYLLRSLMYSGLNTDGWSFQMPITMNIKTSIPVSMRMGYCHPVFGYIVFELIPADLSAIQRLRHLIRNPALYPKTVVIILVGCETFNEEIQQFSISSGAKNICLLSAQNFKDVASGLPLRFSRLTSPETAISFECDDFDERLHILPEEGSPC